MIPKRCSTLLVSLLVLSNFFNLARAQDVPGTRDTIHSQFLGETRSISVVLPDNYKPGSGIKYDVLYVLDAEDDARKILNIERFAESYNFVPPQIIVNIYTIYFNDRDKDLTPTHIDSLPTSGGAKNFLSFMKNELVPYIDKKYATSGDNTLYGHSIGGLFTLYAFLNEHSVFKSYIVTDPSLWWDHGYMNKELAKGLKNPALANKTIWIGGRDGRYRVQMGINVMDGVFKVNAPAQLRWKTIAYPNETHFSMIYKNAYDGLKFTYSGYNPGSMEFHPMDGIVLRDKPFSLYFYNPLPKNPAIRYTTDGSVPSALSAKMRPVNTISGGTTQINIKSFSFRKRYDTMLTAHYKIGKVMPSIQKPKNVEAGGFHYNYYEGSWDKLPDFSQLKPIKTGLVDKNFVLNKLPSQNNFALLIEGYIEIKQDGYYTFLLNSDDGSRFYLGNQLLIDFDGSHGRWDLKSYMVPLQKGFYPIRVEYFQKVYDLFLGFEYIIPGGARQTYIPFENRYH